MYSVSIVAHLNAGGISGRGAVAKLQAACNKRNIEYNLYISQYKEHTKKLIVDVANKTENLANHRIVVVGGDGTLNEAIYGLVSSGSKIPIAYFPSGTGNDFSRSKMLTNDVENFLDNIFGTRKEEVQLIKSYDSNNKVNFVALNGFGIGFDALIARLNDSGKGKNYLNKLKLGKVSYLSKIVDAFKKRSTFNAIITIDEQKVIDIENILFLTLMKNEYFGGGIRINPHNANNSDSISLIVAKNITVKDIMQLLPHILLTGRHFDKSEKFERIIGGKFKIEVAELQDVQADGELMKLENMKIEAEVSTYPMYLVRK